eukprot:1958212-Rhodomonas_salina.2
MGAWCRALEKALEFPGAGAVKAVPALGQELLHCHSVHGSNSRAMLLVEGPVSFLEGIEKCLLARDLPLEPGDSGGVQSAADCMCLLLSPGSTPGCAG